jgi:shikimate kinase/3-dehydroquinate synthase
MPLPPLAEDAPIFIVGFMATGKTTVGRILAARLGWGMLDLDDEIVRAAGMSVPEIFATRGEAAFRDEEARAVRVACARRQTVVATGGGAVCREESLGAMLASGTVVALAVTPEEAVRRAGQASGRPLLDGRADPIAAAAALLAARRPFYARAHLQVDTTGKDPAAVASEILDNLGRGVLAGSLPMTSATGASSGDAGATVGVELGARRYDVRIGRFAPDAVADALADALEPGGLTGVAVLVDRDVGARSPRVAPLVEALRARLAARAGTRAATVDRFDLPAGEASKTLAEIARTTEWLATRGYDRRAAVVGVGGGAATDHAGFAAAIYLRGVRFALVPTTLLGMVDAAVGGKTAVDLPAGKNLVGAFHQPRAVVADLGFLDTLPRRELVAGLAEVAKCGFIADPELLALLEGGAAARPEAYGELVARAVRVKAEVVAEDETEGGRRAILNFGHTVGHAIEAASGYGMLHGEAVALGMMAALSLGAARGITPPPLVERARALLDGLGLPTDVERRIAAAGADILPRLGVDKKRRGGAIKFVFCSAPGETRLVEVTPDEIARHFRGDTSSARS